MQGEAYHTEARHPAQVKAQGLLLLAAPMLDALADTVPHGHQGT